MLSEERIRKMIRLSDFESGQGGTDLKRTHYKKADYVRLQLLKTAVAVFVACVLVVVLIAIYQLEYWMQHMFDLPYSQILLWSTMVLTVCEVIALIVSARIASRQYDESKLRIKEYDATLRELLELYEDEDGQEETVV